MPKRRVSSTNGSTAFPFRPCAPSRVVDAQVDEERCRETARRAPRAHDRGWRTSSKEVRHQLRHSRSRSCAKSSAAGGARRVHPRGSASRRSKRLELRDGLEARSSRRASRQLSGGRLLDRRALPPLHVSQPRPGHLASWACGVCDERSEPDSAPHESSAKEWRCLSRNQVARFEPDEHECPEHRRDQPPTDGSDRDAFPVPANRHAETKHRDVHARNPDRHPPPPGWHLMQPPCRANCKKPQAAVNLFEPGDVLVLVDGFTPGPGGVGDQESRLGYGGRVASSPCRPTASTTTKATTMPANRSRRDDEGSYDRGQRQGRSLESTGLLELFFEEDAPGANITTEGTRFGGGTSQRQRSATATSTPPRWVGASSVWSCSRCGSRSSRRSRASSPTRSCRARRSNRSSPAVAETCTRRWPSSSASPRISSG